MQSYLGIPNSIPMVFSECHILHPQLWPVIEQTWAQWGGAAAVVVAGGNGTKPSVRLKSNNRPIIPNKSDCDYLYAPGDGIFSALNPLDYARATFKRDRDFKALVEFYCIYFIIKESAFVT